MTDPRRPAGAHQHDGGVVGRFRRLLAGGDQAQDSQDLPQRMCAAAVRVLSVDGAGLAARSEPSVSLPLGASDPEVAEAERLQFTLGDGPCHHAYESGRPVLVRDLLHPEESSVRLWPVWLEQMAERTQYRAVLSFPLSVHGLVVGSVDLYRRWPADVLATADLADMDEVADAIAPDLLLAGAVPAGRGEDDFRWLDTPSAQARRSTWQAVGMVESLLRVAPAEALDLLRAHAYGRDRLVDEVAADVVSGELPVERLRA